MGTAALASSRRYGEAMSSTPAASFTPREIPVVQRVIRIWSRTITIGFSAKRSPHVAGARLCVCVSEIGSSNSNAA